MIAETALGDRGLLVLAAELVSEPALGLADDLEPA
jgi:hypothetical protein